jgi:hypothetical protein
VIILLQSIVASATTIEHESTTITATLKIKQLKDVLVSIVLVEQQLLNDYTNSFPSKGEESLIATIQGYSSTYVNYPMVDTFYF